MRLNSVQPPLNFTVGCWVTRNQVPSMSTIKHLINTEPAVTNRTHKRPKTHTKKCELAANSVCALTELWRAVSCHRTPGHAIVIMTVILVIIRKRRS